MEGGITHSCVSTTYFSLLAITILCYHCRKKKGREKVPAPRPVKRSRQVAMESDIEDEKAHMYVSSSAIYPILISRNQISEEAQGTDTAIYC